MRALHTQDCVPIRLTPRVNRRGASCSVDLETQKHSVLRLPVSGLAQRFPKRLRRSHLPCSGSRESPRPGFRLTVTLGWGAGAPSGSVLSPQGCWPLWSRSVFGQTAPTRQPGSVLQPAAFFSVLTSVHLLCDFRFSSQLFFPSWRLLLFLC